MKSGKNVSDDLMVNLIYKRIQFPDVVKNGYVLNGWPKNVDQVKKLVGKGIVPMLVVCMQIDEWTVKLRAHKMRTQGRFKLDSEILNERLKLDCDN